MTNKEKEKKQWEECRKCLKESHKKALEIPSSRERSIVLTKLEEALMWADRCGARVVRDEA